MFKINILDTGAILKICSKLTVKISEWYHRCSSGDCIVHFEQAQKQSFPNFQYNGCPEKFPKIHGKTFRSSPFLVKLFKKDFYLRNFPINFFFFFFFFLRYFRYLVEHLRATTFAQCRFQWPWTRVDLLRQ